MSVEFNTPLSNHNPATPSPPTRPTQLNITINNNVPITHEIHPETPKRRRSRLSFEHDLHDKTLTPEEENKTIHGFNQTANITVIDTDKTLLETTVKGGGTDGSDSGVEIHPTEDLCPENGLFQRYSPRSSCGGGLDDTESTHAFSENSSICSAYDEAFERLQVKNSTVLEDLARHSYILRNDERASENGSESSITGSVNGDRKTPIVKKRVALREPPTTPTRLSRKQKSVEVVPQTPRSRSKSNSKTSLTGLNSATRSKSGPNNKTTPRTPLMGRKLETTTPKRDTSVSRGNLKVIKTRTPVSTPSDDGRWPSTGSKSTPITMGRAPRATIAHCNPDTGNVVRNLTALAG